MEIAVAAIDVAGLAGFPHATDVSFSSFCGKKPITDVILV
jgi:hypothetical protein